jgi:hypothetical protein
LASASFFVSSFSAAIVPFLPVAFPRTARVITRYAGTTTPTTTVTGWPIDLGARA